jgi:2-C-methyl-D-erythritol 4-phosphate cytidylyltransferase/2-C-methyl-D-erythritol 2,4-cyclodiphosphate synthase
MKVITLIVAGGYGNRFNHATPKQYVSSTLRKTIEKFTQSKTDLIQVVIREEDQDLYNEATYGFDLLPPVFGGSSRGESVKNGLDAIAQYKANIVLIHDANRPFLSTKLINDVIDLLKQHPNTGVVPVIEVPETVKRIKNNNAEIIDRNDLFLIQTPQGFYFKDIWNIYKTEKHFLTDESSLAERYNIPIIYIRGERKNIKITYQEDDEMNKEIRCGSGFDAHRFSPEKSDGNSIILGGVNIPFPQKIEAHSDGDVLIHALVDALLGSIGEGDIGMCFPPSDIKWKNANSKIFLLHANNLLKNKNGIINNIDITLICEKPHLSNYRLQIRNNLAQILEITENRINIKATTTEKMGFTGRGEGIAVQAMVTIKI